MPADDKVLIVEDNPLIAEAVERAGKQLELHADLATDGWEAIELLRSERYAAIVIDTDLPRHSGFGVLTFLRQENGEDLANVILMTSGDRDDVLRRVSEERLRVIQKTEVVDEIAAALLGLKS
jgi:two-component system OmpR family response regulator